MNQTIQRCYLLGHLLLSSVLIPNIATAQISSDGTLSTTVTSDDGVNFLIESGVRTSDHLFHSFSEFSVPSNGSAFFNNAGDIVNIFSRVTGGNISNIDGLIHANGNANLFLINPAGIIFGQNASIGLGGSFFATTAESVVFGDGIEFSATEPNQAPLLTINITPGLQMGTNPGNITVTGPGQILNGSLFAPFDRSNFGSQLQVQPGNTIALVGGSISLRGGLLSAEGGQIEIAAVGSNNSSAMVPLTPVASGWDLDLSQLSNLGDIQLTENALLDTSGNTAGSIRLRGATITVGDNSSILTQNEGSQSAGNTILHGTESVTIGDNDANGSFNTFVANLSISSGDGGDIEIITKNLNVLGGAHLLINAFGEGDSGNINIVAPESVNIIGWAALNPENPSDLTSDVNSLTFSKGRAGDITISTNQLKIAVGHILTFTAGEGDGGNITLNATESIDIVGLLSGVNRDTAVSAASFGEGDGGNVEVNTARLWLTDGGVIDASAFDSGNAGSVTINASESVTLLDTLPTRSTTTLISSRVGRPIPIFRRLFGLDPIPTANAGNITINTSELTISGDPDTQDAEIRVRNEGFGDGGELFIKADTINLNYGATITASTFSGKKGNINLDITNGLLLRNGSSITAEADNDSDGGKITINSDLVTLMERSLIQADANRGNGGEIKITTQGLFVFPDSAITASSQFGVDGVITINNPDADPANGLIQLPTELRDRTQQIAKGCGWTATSSFYITGRGGIPQDPSAMVPGGQILSDVRDISDLSIVRAIPQAEDRKPDTNTKAPIVEANAWIINSEGNLELVAVVNSSQAGDFLRATCAIKED
ncbi:MULTISPECIES: filamentous hemagglutinin N-terminal domain-containing protein [unclassified Moorena]|uniref:two-partner secretion domain-containing protein n=1 Tax=unclassified Moorena TaxID=2683338 RepID=UPI0013CCDC7C|nr:MULTISPECIES: filamentous hemagglutinin N-terminal domain-containing protein [unclassified Moorena]NEO21588.1 filamentous hemagglutinin N-terminal domain-containing protein [Moorena sp. SIO4A5]NEQ61841.1 filamentous hemagglutinin N-terminal domain-containing protein [Moorena sp. SIO4A1]